RQSAVALVPRNQLDDWRAGEIANPGVVAGRDNDAQAIAALLDQRGALFFDDISRETGLTAAVVEQGLRSLIHEGAVTADAFSPLLDLLRPAQPHQGGRKRKPAPVSTLPPGRWSLLRAVPTAEPPLGPRVEREQQLATVCHALLQRYGIVFRAVLARETLLPPWRELLHALRRMEDRGEVLGGRFVDGFAGEQFALPEVPAQLSAAARGTANTPPVVIAASDPLNLGGILVPGPKTPALAGNRILLEDGLPTARLVRGEIETLPGAGDRTLETARVRLPRVTSLRDG
ncbi:MAG: ATP-dependent DNA helicase, partial [Pseudomonadota bacterium]